MIKVKLFVPDYGYIKKEIADKISQSLSVHPETAMAIIGNRKPDLILCIENGNLHNFDFKNCVTDRLVKVIGKDIKNLDDKSGNYRASIKVFMAYTDKGRGMKACTMTISEFLKDVEGGVTRKIDTEIHLI